MQGTCGGVRDEGIHSRGHHRNLISETTRKEKFIIQFFVRHHEGYSTMIPMLFCAREEDS